ncbi:hypothetical protein WR25_19570 isoform B [Diploscapter pachys]|uniref:Uncharacterized protein n=1 Tax=Diploscapter pachys TaxID=2018661 RepID=A0A2A2JEJ8_9BILA|nr:hypothetical protein WR25_19570 isoform A [Diploscapter pachys]PAV60085.1 hypothetical protein WR25_19570 isoform B [Diploscapter pachys]
MLLRGFLEKNLGEWIPPSPEAIPIEVLEKPHVGCDLETETDRKYATLSFRLLFERVELDCLLPVDIDSVNRIGPWKPFAEMQLVQARISFDSFIDGQSELDLICEQTGLTDKRILSTKNLFPNILQQRRSTVSEDETKVSLMFEVHVMMRAEEAPLVTVVLVNSSLILLYDWLDTAKNFVLLTPDMYPNFYFSIPQKSRASTQSILSRVEETILQVHKQTFTMKVTLRSCDLFVIEDMSMENSLALIARVTAVVNANDAGGRVTGNLEVQTISLSWCSMSNIAKSRNECSNEFMTTISLEVDQRKSSAKGLPIVQRPKHHAIIELDKAVGRVSYRDVRIFQVILVGFQRYLQSLPADLHILPVEHRIDAQPFIDLDKITVKFDQAEIWLLDDFDENSIPLARFSASRMNLSWSDRIVAAFTVAVDYFNHHVFGWEPFIENWAVLQMKSFVKDNTRTFEIVTETHSTLDINITEQFLQQAIQFSSRWPSVCEAIERDGLRTAGLRTRCDQLPYLLRNDTGSDLMFTTEVSDLLTARAEHRKYSVRWMTVPTAGEHMFQFPVRLLYTREGHDPCRQLIIRVSGWDEASPVAVDSCGTYFRIVKAMQDGLSNARLVIGVTMDKDGKKIVSIQSSITISNRLPDRVAVYSESAELMQVEPGARLPVPLKHVNERLRIYPLTTPRLAESAEMDWRKVRKAGDVINAIHVLQSEKKTSEYWICTAIKRESYPEEETEPLPGHTMHFVAPLQIQNLLPIDAEFNINGSVVAIGAGKQIQLTSVDITKSVKLQLSTDRLSSKYPITILKSQIGEGQLLHIRMTDSEQRPLDVYANIQSHTAGTIGISIWTPFWIINKSGIPLVIRQEAVLFDAAGQMEEHEKARDRHPLMFSFADDGCPKQCVLRVGGEFVQEGGYMPCYSSRFALAPGVQALKLKIEHKTLPTKYYNIGVEVRAGTGRYKDTQVVLLTTRYSLSNLCSVSLTLSHADLIERQSEHVRISPQSTLVWNENYEQRRMLCVKRVDTKHWSCPFPIDRIGSFHVTMRDSDETPRFVRVEIILAGAVFCISFTDAHFYPPPIRIENLSDVPILYQQFAAAPTKQHLRTICKARSHVDYAWDDLYGEKKILLQVFENKFHCYDPCVVGNGASLQYENHLFIQLKSSFDKSTKKSNLTEECELVLETLEKGKVILNKQHRIDGNSGNQLWKLCNDGCIENIGMTARTKTRMVLDMIEKGGKQLMMLPRIQSRDKTQKWTFMPDGRICPQSNLLLFATAKRTEVCLEENDRDNQVNEDGVALSQCWKIQRQRPGSGTLDVECLHHGPTLVLRITDREEHNKKKADMQRRSASKEAKEFGYALCVTMRNGIGVSVINSLSEELVYGRMSGISLFASLKGNYQMTASIDSIQIEFDVTPRNYYYSFDCFRMKLCELTLHIDALLLWKLIHFAQSSNASASVQQKSLSLPPNTDLQRHDPLKTTRCYFGTLELEMGQISLSVSTVPKVSLTVPLRQLKQQFNIKLVSFENALVVLPPFRQLHYFETSSFLLESLRNFYFSELQKKTFNVIMTLDAFGNPQGLATDLKDSFQGLFIEGDVSRFVAGLGYGVSNSISKVASSVSSGVGSLTFDVEHEAKRRHNMTRSQSASSTPLTHLYSGVKGLGVGLFGGFTAIPTNVLHEAKKSGPLGAVKGLTTGAVDTITKPVQGVFDFLEGTASAVKKISAPSTSRHNSDISRIRPSRLCRDLHCLVPSYSYHLAAAQQELLRINGFSTKERLLDVEVCFEQFTTSEQMVRQYCLISTKQCYVCKQVTSPGQSSTEPSSVIMRVAYKYLKCVQASPELPNTLASVEIQVETDENRTKLVHIWCVRSDVARRLADKIQRAKQEYDHGKRAVKDLDTNEEKMDLNSQVIKPKKYYGKTVFIASACMTAAMINFLNAGSCSNSNRQSTLLSAKDSVCCDGLIKTLTETALSTTGFIPGQSQFVDIAGKTVKAVQAFIQSHFGTAFEVIIAKSQFALKTHYKGSKLCKFEANGWYLAIYETPGNYDINDSTKESYFDSFSSKDPLGVKGLSLGSLSSASSSFSSSVGGFLGK